MIGRLPLISCWAIFFCATAAAFQIQSSSRSSTSRVVKNHHHRYQKIISSSSPRRRQSLIIRQASIDAQTASASASASASSSTKDSNSRATPLKKNKSRSSLQDLDLPWGKRQSWALKDCVNKYLVEIPQLQTNGDDNNNNNNNDNDNNDCTYVMWRALTRENIELAGYDIEFLRLKYVHAMADDADNGGGSGNGSNTDAPVKTIADSKTNTKAPGALPLLDNFEFQSNGGVSGKIQGLRGIADGTTVQTSPLIHVQLTIPRGYVLTEDGSAAYELGFPLSEERYSLDIAKMNVNVNNINMPRSMSSISIDGDELKKTLKSGAEETGKVALSIADTIKDLEMKGMLVNLGASTAILLGGATALNMLAHHLTVNVFWV